MPDEGTPQDPANRTPGQEAPPEPPPAPSRPEAVTVTAPENALPEVTLEALPDALRDAVARAGWPSLLPVQARTIPYMLARRDLMVQSRTGSGKTGAFLLPILERTDFSKDACQALILVPTRELALQVAHNLLVSHGRVVPVIRQRCPSASHRTPVSYGMTQPASSKTRVVPADAMRRQFLRQCCNCHS